MKTVAQSVEILDAEQQRLVSAVRSVGERGWSGAGLADAAEGSLVGRGHFVDQPDELTFTVQDLVGHLCDSATVYGARIKVIREMDRPSFGDFATTESARLERYRTLDFAAGVDRMIWTHQYLRSQLAQVGADDLVRVGIHEHRGEVTLASIVDYLPDHLSDHLAQLRVLASV